MSACEELDGRPKYHVMRFQVIAPTSPAKMASRLIASGLTTSCATVAATLSDTKAPTKLRMEA